MHTSKKEEALALERSLYAKQFAQSGGLARAKALKPPQRRAIARKAALARWAKQMARDVMKARRARARRKGASV
jgi:hypothetical protein